MINDKTLVFGKITFFFLREKNIRLINSLIRFLTRVTLAGIFFLVMYFLIYFKTYYFPFL